MGLDVRRILMRPTPTLPRIFWGCSVAAGRASTPAGIRGCAPRTPRHRPRSAPSTVCARASPAGLPQERSSSVVRSRDTTCATNRTPRISRGWPRPSTGSTGRSPTRWCSSTCSGDTCRPLPLRWGGGGSPPTTSVRSSTALLSMAAAFALAPIHIHTLPSWWGFPTYHQCEKLDGLGVDGCCLRHNPHPHSHPSLAVRPAWALGLTQFAQPGNRGCTSTVILTDEQAAVAGGDALVLLVFFFSSFADVGEHHLVPRVCAARVLGEHHRLPIRFGHDCIIPRGALSPQTSTPTWPP